MCEFLTRESVTKGVAYSFFVNLERRVTSLTFLLRVLHAHVKPVTLLFSAEDKQTKMLPTTFPSHSAVGFSMQMTSVVHSKWKLSEI